MSNLITNLCRPLIMSPAQKAVLMCLADYAHDDGKDWHSISSVMAWTCLGRTAVIEAFKVLEDRGLIAVQRAKGLKSRTILQLDMLASAAAKVSAAKDTEACDPSGSRTGAAPEPVRLAEATSPAPELPPIRQANEPVRQADPKHQEASEQASVKHHNKRASSPKASRRLPDGSLPEWMPIEAWTAYIDMRDGMRKPMSETAQFMAIKKLGQWHDDGHNVEGILENSVLAGYQGLFPPRTSISDRGAGATSGHQRTAPRRGPLTAEQQRAESLAKADRLMAAMNASGCAQAPTEEGPLELTHG